MKFSVRSLLSAGAKTMLATLRPSGKTRSMRGVMPPALSHWRGRHTDAPENLLDDRARREFFDEGRCPGPPQPSPQAGVPRDPPRHVGDFGCRSAEQAILAAHHLGHRK